jgi:release factor glutamine methyltransferase
MTEAERRGLAPEVAGHEPAGALVAGNDAAAIIRRLLPQAAQHLRPGGSLHLEIAPGLRDEVAVLMKSAGFSSIKVRADALGLPRVVSGVL